MPSDFAPAGRLVVIRVDGLGKEYPLGLVNPGDTLRDMMAGAFRRNRTAHHTRGGQPRTRWALRDVNLEICRGEIVGLVGANGAGKSTLLKILSRIVYPTTGVAEVRGRVGSLLEVGTGFHPELTGRENVFLSGALLGMRQAEIRSQFDEIVAFAEVEASIDLPVKHYSSGMYLRLGFAVAAHLRPEILIVDEVLAVGDIAFQRKCLGKMSEVSDSGRTVVFVSHNMAAVTRLCSRAYWLDKGLIRRQGDARDVVAAYLGDAAPGVTHRTWTEGAPGDDSIRLEGVSVESVDGARVAGMTQDRPFAVRMRYRILRPLADSNVGFELKAADGTVVLTSYDSDHAGTAGQPRSPGLFEASCLVPGTLLNEGRYTLSFSGGIPFVTLAFRVEDALALEIAPALPEAGAAARLPVKRPGVVAPLLSWRTDPQG